MASFKKIVAVAAVGATCLIADPITIVDEQDFWQYSILSQENINLDPIWESVGYATVDFNKLTWTAGQAAFAENKDFPQRHTVWASGTDLALQKEVFIDGTLNGDLTLNLDLDNGAIIFVNGETVFKDWQPYSYTHWEYTKQISSSAFHQGTNVIQVLAAGESGPTYFDMKLTGDVIPAAAVPEPALFQLLGMGILCLGGAALRKRR